MAKGKRQKVKGKRQTADNKVWINGYKKFGYLFAELARNFYLTIHKLINVSLLYNFISGNRKLCLLPCLVPTLVFRVNISSKETTLTMLIKRIWRFFDPDTKPLSESQNDRHHFTRKKGRRSKTVGFAPPAYLCLPVTMSSWQIPSVFFWRDAEGSPFFIANLCLHNGTFWNVSHLLILIKHRFRFYEIARSSLVELDTQIEISCELNYLNRKQLDELSELLNANFALLSSMINHRT